MHQLRRDSGKDGSFIKEYVCFCQWNEGISLKLELSGTTSPGFKISLLCSTLNSFFYI